MRADAPIPPDTMNPAAPDGASCAAVLMKEILTSLPRSASKRP